jgi:hypothetical protein
VLSSTANGQLQSYDEYKLQQQLDNTGNKRTKKQQNKQQARKNGSAKAFYNQLLKISVHLQTSFAAGTYLAEGATELGSK